MFLPLAKMENVHVVLFCSARSLDLLSCTLEGNVLLAGSGWRQKVPWKTLKNAKEQLIEFGMS